jgi:hypothetical protein
MEPTYLWSCKCQSAGGAYGTYDRSMVEANKHLNQHLDRTDLHTAYLGRAADSITISIGISTDADPTVPS